MAKVLRVVTTPADTGGKGAALELRLGPHLRQLGLALGAFFVQLREHVGARGRQFLAFACDSRGKPARDGMAWHGMVWCGVVWCGGV